MSPEGRDKIKRIIIESYVILATPEAEIRRIAVRGLPRQQKQDLISKIPNAKKDWWSGSSDREPA
jgi:hypothetical protein